MACEGRRESPDGSGEEEGGDAVGLGKDGKFEVGRVVNNQIDLVKLTSARRRLFQLTHIIFPSQSGVVINDRKGNRKTSLHPVLCPLSRTQLLSEQSTELPNLFPTPFMLFIDVHILLYLQTRWVGRTSPNFISPLPSISSGP